MTATAIKKWAGVVVIQRKPNSDTVKIMSSRTQAMGMRVICLDAPLDAVRHMLRDGDGEFVTCYAEYIGDGVDGHLQLIERADTRHFLTIPEEFSCNSMA